MSKGSYEIGRHELFGGVYVECSTGLCSTIQIKEKLFDNLKSWDVWLELCGTENWQLSNIKLIELNQAGDYVWLILISTLIVEHNINWSKSGQQFCSINAMFY